MDDLKNFDAADPYAVAEAIRQLAVAVEQLQGKVFVLESEIGNLEGSIAILEDEAGS